MHPAPSTNTVVSLIVLTIVTATKTFPPAMLNVVDTCGFIYYRVVL
jgi:hypothetical protein